ncbi:alpha/beta fold hydrolase [Gemmatimonas groenlandica]|uniref:Alpha/beta hydrolase n=1 Tax=Gemmatimonas groenlandica TaxID=2732249 RepID=A0A6M4IM41_9BACT|nr:alpha/beta fold hydrolase [Gemmatimonas groenlandica]QJR35730.1 alpha/beta hydrolase [Gemmatimonas groenlandica]
MITSLTARLTLATGFGSTALLALGLLLPGPESSAARARRAPGERRVVVAPAETLSVNGGAVGMSRGDVVVLLLPGPVGSAFSMRSVVRELQARGIQPFVVDPLGMGASTRSKGADYTLSAQAVRIAKVLESELPAGVSVIVAAQGTSATIAFHLAATDTARVRGVVSIAGGPIDKQGTSGVRTALTFAALLDNPIGRGFAKRRFVSALRDQSADDRWLTNEVVKQYVAPIENDLRGLLRTLGAMQASVEQFPIESRLTRITVPVRLLVGDKPSASAPSAAQVTLLQAHVKRFAVDTLRPGGTMLHEERAADVARAIDEMVRGARK